MVLDKVNNPNDLKKLNIDEKNKLAFEIRNIIINQVLEKGGHLSSNLGVVELTIALYSSINLPIDKVIWDVGHQTYTHKILTGRKKGFKTIRQFGGLSGFPKSKESEYDFFDVGHSSTSISVALGMARARDILKTNENIFAVIGDGALTGGMALEALNDAGISDTDITIILNDNEMSISKNTGGFSRFLSKLRTRKLYINSNRRVKKVIRKLPLGGKAVKLAEWSKKRIKGLIIQNMFFENIGYTYLGPVNGHSISDMEDIFKRAKNIKGPKLIHVITTKGKGYYEAEKNPNKYHAISGKDAVKVRDYSSVFGDKLVDFGLKNDKVVAITAAMKQGTGLSKFAYKFPLRFFDVEIAEQHALTMACGMAKSGLIPFVCIYSSFLQRGYDQIVHDIALNNLHVIICVDRAGIVGNDGETHQGVLDLSFLNTVPNLTVMAPKNFKELEDMMEFALKFNRMIALRYPRGGEDYKFKKNSKIEYGKCEVLSRGRDITIVAIGKMTSHAMKVKDLLSSDDVSVEVINARFMNPLDILSIKKSYEKTKCLFTIEDNIVSSGFGYKVKANLNGDNIYCFGYPNEFIVHGSVEEIEKKYGLDVMSIYVKIKDIYSNYL